MKEHFMSRYQQRTQMVVPVAVLSTTPYVQNVPRIPAGDFLDSVHFNDGRRGSMNFANAKRRAFINQTCSYNHHSIQIKRHRNLTDVLPSFLVNSSNY
ncbi:hypothetical protein CEXT_593941 [Caerostris extrusa]|uniref:Uncharacterized protein n=1 Tax=Caerostris extrusa TaxID=172846 RepID=A0AAV4SSX6_CAEEX|nr:hypothetical protein CEXT_593941 [Caerostris extrusa]